MIIKIYLYLVAFNIICFLLCELYLRYKFLVLKGSISPLTAFKNIFRVKTAITRKWLLGFILVPFMSTITLIQLFYLSDKKFLNCAEKEN